MGVTARDKRSGWDYRKTLLLWIGYQVKGRFPVPTDFRSTMRDGRVLLTLLHSILPNEIFQMADAQFGTNHMSSTAATGATNSEETFDSISGEPTAQAHSSATLSPSLPPSNSSSSLTSSQDMADASLARFLEETNLSPLEAAQRRAERIVQLATVIGLGDYISVFDIMHGVDRVNLVFCAQLLRMYPSIDTFTVLITRGIQNDYCGLQHRSSVHIGSDEAYRLFGTRDASTFSSPGYNSPLVSLVKWAREQPEESFALIHVRDLHRLDDREASEHLMKFGPHCIEGESGSALVSDLLENDAQLSQNEYLVNVRTGISDTHGTGFEQILQKIKERAHGFLVRVGVIGVSTDFQVNNLLFELQTRFDIKNLATCSALTAARTRNAHFSALDNIERFLNTNVFHSIADFTHWLAPNKATVHLAHNTPTALIEDEETHISPTPNLAPTSVSPGPSPLPSGAPIYPLHGLKPSHDSPKSSTRSSSPSPFKSRLVSTPPNSGPAVRLASIFERVEFDEKHLMSSEDLFILDALFRNASRVVIVSKLRGGFSGSAVLLAKSYDLEGHEQGPFVVKLGQIDAVAQERTNFERVEEILGHQAPYVYASYEAHKKAGLKFAFASHCGDMFTTTTFKESYANMSTQQEFVEATLQKVASALNRFYTVARMRPWDLLRSYDFDGHGWALAAGGSDEPAALASRIASLCLISDASEVERSDTLELLPGLHVYNVWKLMRDGEEMELLRRWTAAQRFLISFVHGDLNFSNILIDGSVNVWLIDFQYTTKAHYLKDLGKLENDCKMEIDLESQEEYEHAVKLTQLLHEYSPYDETDLEDDNLKKQIDVLPAKLQRACYTSLFIRSLIRQTNMGRETDPTSYHVTMLRYALHSMCFHHLSNWTRKWSLANACSHAQHIIDVLYSKSADE